MVIWVTDLLAIFYGINMGMSHQAQLNDALNVKSQVNDEIVEDINNDKALQLNSSNNEINQFMIHEFKNIYRVKA